MSKKEIDYLLVGQGLAGTVLAHQLLEQGKNIRIIDLPGLSACSRISGGIYNPVVLRRLTGSWMADELLPVLKMFYEKMERQLGTKFLSPLKIVRLFSEKQERDFWEKKRGEPVGRYLSEVSDEPLPELGTLPFGHAHVLHAGRVNVPEFLERSWHYFRSKDILAEEAFDHSGIRFVNDKVEYGHLNAQKIIFCEGYRAAENPFFKMIPFNPAKGELLKVGIENFHFTDAISKGVTLVPLEDGSFRVSSTYSWDPVNDEITGAAKEELLNGVREIISRNAEVLDQKAGVRPATRDRRPVLGLHPGHPQLGIFNGLGSKGVMLAPYFAAHFYDHLEKGTALMGEVNVGRFLKGE